MRFCLRVKVLGWRLQVQSNADPSHSPPASPSLSSSASFRPALFGATESRMPERDSASSAVSPSEKGVKKPRDYLAIGVTLVRLWQFASAVFVYVTMLSLFLYIRHTRHFNAPLQYVQQSGLVSLTYSIVVLGCTLAFRRWKKLSGWPVFAWGTFAGDLMMMGLAIAKITLLSQAGVPHNCGGLVPSDKPATSDKILLTQVPGGEISYTALPSASGDLCHIPRTVYAFCVVSVFSHTLSILLTVFQIQRYHKQGNIPESLPHPGHIEVAVPSHAFNRGPSPSPLRRMAPPARPHPPSIRRNALPSQPPVSAPPSYPSSPSLTCASTYSPGSTFSAVSTISTQTQYSTGPSLPNPPSSLPPTAPFSSCSPRGPSNRLPAQDDPNKYANMPPMEIISYNPRVSQESASTNPEIYLVADGFRPEEPPEYTSRPSSLFNGRQCP